MKPKTKACLTILGSVLAAGVVILLPSFMPPVANGGQPRDFRESARTAEKNSPPGDSRPGDTIRQLTWDDLVPRDWDPMKSFKGLDLQNLVDSDPRAMKALDALMEVWRNAPVRSDLGGTRLRIPGYVIPLEQDKGGMTEFLLVPYFGACIHTPPPPSNQIIHGMSGKPVAGFRTMDAAWVTGVLEAVGTSTSFGKAGYRLQVQKVEPYKEPAR